MDEHRKDLAKRFFTLLYLFLTRKYERVEVVFIRHTTTRRRSTRRGSSTSARAAAPSCTRRSS